MTIAARPQPAPPKTTCDAPVKGARCGAKGWWRYIDFTGTWRVFCIQATHAYTTEETYPPMPNGTRERV